MNKETNYNFGLTSRRILGENETNKMFEEKIKKLQNQTN